MNFDKIKGIITKHNLEINAWFMILNIIILIIFWIMNIKISKVSNEIVKDQNTLNNLWLELQNKSNTLQQQSNDINKLLLDLSEKQTLISSKTLETTQKEIYFNTKSLLDNKIINNQKYDLLKEKLDKKEGIMNKELLKDYLNNFEDVYMSCHRSILPKSDVEYTYEFLLWDICSNNYVIEVTQSGYWWLKKLCGIFFPNSKLSKFANMTTNNCK